MKVDLVLLKKKDSILPFIPMTQILPTMPEPPVRAYSSKAPNKDISQVNRFLSPFFYWVFGNVHVMLAGWVDHGEMMKGLGRLSGVKGVGGLEVEMVEGGGGTKDIE